MPDIRYVDWPAKSTLVDTDEFSISDAAGNYHHIKPLDLSNQIMARFQPKPISGRWINSSPAGRPQIAGAALANGKLYVVPFRLYHQTPVAQIGGVQATHLAGNTQWGVYANTGALPSGATPLGNTSSIASVGVGSEIAGTIAGGSLASGGQMLLPAGLYWFGGMNSANFAYMRCDTDYLMSFFFGSNAHDQIGGDVDNTFSAYSTTVTFGTWPDAGAATWTKQIGSGESTRWASPSLLVA